jgi:hypothetical protein
MLQRDYLMRMIEQFVQAIGRMLGLAKSGNFEDARTELDAAWSSLGVSRRMVERLDDASLRLLLGDDKVGIVVMLLDAEAELLAMEGKHAEARSVAARAAQLKPERA